MQGFTGIDILIPSTQFTDGCICQTRQLRFRSDSCYITTGRRRTTGAYVLYWYGFISLNFSPVNLLRTAAEEPNRTTPVLTDLQNLERSLLDVVSMIDRVQTYVQSILDGDIEGDPSIGRFLLDTLNTTTEGLEKGKLESLFNIHVQVRCARSIDQILILFLGHANGVIPRKPGPIPSRSL